jgi:hypothetical protein
MEVESLDLPTLEGHLGSDWIPVKDVTLWLRKNDDGDYTARTKISQPETLPMTREEFSNFFEGGEREEKEEEWVLHTSKGEFASSLLTLSVSQSSCCFQISFI